MSAGIPSLSVLMKRAQEEINQRKRHQGFVLPRPWVVNFSDQGETDADRECIAIEARRRDPFCSFAISFFNGGPGGRQG